ncbi:hypothetical protein GUJ93_ZPchr0006g45877 [Zizania palustris]|uniref:Uncharacterized protein n=1 Tax=Zizania palustris TaxID=103762 RepID=A0A8J5VSA2_ZIZPA|nr:hypothetical protein GUJ93_ZPchr0006g45877 [Zizania palustris]
MISLYFPSLGDLASIKRVFSRLKISIVFIQHMDTQHCTVVLYIGHGSGYSPRTQPEAPTGHRWSCIYAMVYSHIDGQSLSIFYTPFLNNVVNFYHKI